MEKNKFNSSQIDLIKKEVDLMERVKGHRNIVTLYDCYEDSSTLYLVLELVSGGELFDKIQEVEFYSEKDGSKILEALLRALHCCHENSVIHRDLKPENVLCGTKKFEDLTDIKLTDFGLAGYCEENKKIRGSCGTVDYSAPEIINDVEYDHSIDMWSFGVLTYIVLGGYAPFQDTNQSKLKNLIKIGEFEFHSPEWDEVSEIGKDFIRKLIVVDPSKRMTPNQALQHPFIGAKEELSDTKNKAAANAFNKYMAQKKMRATVISVMASNRLANTLSIFGKPGGLSNLLSSAQPKEEKVETESKPDSTEKDNLDKDTLVNLSNLLRTLITKQSNLIEAAIEQKKEMENIESTIQNLLNSQK